MHCSRPLNALSFSAMRVLHDREVQNWCKYHTSHAVIKRYVNCSRNKTSKGRHAVINKTGFSPGYSFLVTRRTSPTSKLETLLVCPLSTRVPNGPAFNIAKHSRPSSPDRTHDGRTAAVYTQYQRKPFLIPVAIGNIYDANFYVLANRHYCVIT